MPNERGPRFQHLFRAHAKCHGHESEWSGDNLCRTNRTPVFAKSMPTQNAVGMAPGGGCRFLRFELPKEMANETLAAKPCSDTS
jgi:hypothetical protein